MLKLIAIAIAGVSAAPSIRRSTCGPVVRQLQRGMTRNLHVRSSTFEGNNPENIFDKARMAVDEALQSLTKKKEQKRKRPFPSQEDLRAVEAQRRELAKHCFGPACNLDHYAGIPELSAQALAPPATANPKRYAYVQEMEKKRRELAEHCFGPDCGLDHYANVPELKLVDDVYASKPYPRYSDVQKMAKSRKNLAKHCFGPSCSIEAYSHVPEIELVSTSAKKMVYPTDAMVKRMEMQRKALAKHCFGPSCSLPSSNAVPKALDVLQSRNDDVRRSKPRGDDVRRSNQKRIDLSKHSSGVKSKRQED